MTDRVSTGAHRLDSLLGGGLPRHAINLVVGPPGSGKTILAQQCLYANADQQRPAVYLSTVSEPLEKIVRFGQSLTFFDPEAIGSKVFYEDLGGLLGEQELIGVLDRIRAIIREHNPGIMVIDSFKALRPYAGGAGDFRRFLHTLTGLLSAVPVTSIWVGEYDANERVTAPEFAVADAIISLGSTVAAERTVRTLHVLKLRGGDFRSGEHTYRISADGVAAFPRLADPFAYSSTPYTLEARRISSGVEALDDMLAEGYWRGAATLVAGPTGAGKTLIGLHFAFAGARRGEPVVIATLQEDPTQLERIVQRFGWSVKDDNITLLYRSPVDLYIDEWVYDVLDTVERAGAQRVLIDSLGDLQAASPDLVRFREYVYSLLHRFSRAGVSVIMTYEIPELSRASRLSEYGASHLSDNVVLLQYRGLDEDTVRRTLTVLKTRASSHDPRVHEFDISTDGIVLHRGDQTTGVPADDHG